MKKERNELFKEYLMAETSDERTHIEYEIEMMDDLLSDYHPWMYVGRKIEEEIESLLEKIYGEELEELTNEVIRDLILCYNENENTVQKLDLDVEAHLDVIYDAMGRVGMYINDDIFKDEVPFIIEKIEELYNQREESKNLAD